MTFIPSFDGPFLVTTTMVTKRLTQTEAEELVGTALIPIPFLNHGMKVSYLSVQLEDQEPKVFMCFTHVSLPLDTFFVPIHIATEKLSDNELNSLRSMLENPTVHGYPSQKPVQSVPLFLDGDIGAKVARIPLWKNDVADSTIKYPLTHDPFNLPLDPSARNEITENTKET